MKSQSTSIAKKRNNKYKKRIFFCCLLNGVSGIDKKVLLEKKVLLVFVSFGRRVL